MPNLIKDAFKVEHPSEELSKNQEEQGFVGINSGDIVASRELEVKNRESQETIENNQGEFVKKFASDRKEKNGTFQERVAKESSREENVSFIERIGGKKKKSDRTFVEMVQPK